MRIESKYIISAGYFGKLPEYGDFIKYNAGAEEIIRLDKWLQDGIVRAKDILKEAWKSIYRKSPRYNFLYSSPDTENLLSGIMFPGRDKSEREFPFLGFIIMKKKILTHMPAYLMPLGFSKYFDLFNMEFKHSAGGESLSSFKTEINNVLMNIQENEIIKYGRYLTETSLKEYFERTLGSFDSPDKYKLTGYLNKYSSKDKYYPERQNNIDNAVPEAIKISLKMDKEVIELDMGFVINLVQVLSARDAELPVIFWSADEHKRAMYLFLNKLSAENYYDLIDPKAKMGKTIDTGSSSEGKTDTGNSSEAIIGFENPSKNIIDSENPSKNIIDFENFKEEMSSEISELLDSPHIMLKEFLEKIARDNKRSFKFWMKLKK